MHKKRATSDTQPAAPVVECRLHHFDEYELYDDLSLQGSEHSEGRVHYPLAEFVSQFF